MANTENLHGTLDINRIMQLIPHRYPFLLIDRVRDIVPDQSAIGVKNVTLNEPYFPGHFPKKPIMPGVLIIEAMAQTSAVLVAETMKEPMENKLVYFMSIDEARFRKPVIPGDVLELHVSKERSRSNVWRFRGEARVDGHKVAEAIVTAMIVDNEGQA
jgi:3-hydroxyacyl-[acyl-carrier-protein] dehydratase